MRCTQSRLNFSLYLYTFSGSKRACTVNHPFQSTLTFGFTFRGHNFSGFQLLKAIRPWCSGIRKTELKSDMWPKIRAPVTGKNTGIGSKNSGFRILESHKDRSQALSYGPRKLGGKTGLTWDPLFGTNHEILVRGLAILRVWKLEPENQLIFHF